MGRKLGAVPLLGELGPHLTMWPEPKPTCMPSFILIHPTVWSQYTNVTDIQTDKPVGFQGPIVPPVPNANSSECPQFGMPADLRSLHAGAARRLLCTLVMQSASNQRIPFDAREVAGMANFKMYLPRQFCSNRVDFFYNIQETQTQKMMDQNFDTRIV